MFKESSWSKSPSLDTHKEPEKRIFPEEMYTVSGFLSPNSRHYKKAKRFDAAISEVASLCNNIHEVDQLTPEERAAAFKKIFPSVPKGLQQVMLSKLLWELPGGDREEIFATGLTTEDEATKIRKYYYENKSLEENPLGTPRLTQMSVVKLLPSKEREAILFDPRYTHLLIQSPLYDKQLVSEATLQRKPFSKSGSEITLLGGDLKHKVIIHHITPDAFVSWQKAYEAHEAWEIAEFDYIPIEPIQSYRLRKDGLVDVASGVLDLNLREWQELFPNIFTQELEAAREAIEDTLETLNINHGHPHYGNFALRFFRNEDGTVDLSRCPRLYLIDFDQAVSWS
jgi:hypothetical protein